MTSLHTISGLPLLPIKNPGYTYDRQKLLASLPHPLFYYSRYPRKMIVNPVDYAYHWQPWLFAFSLRQNKMTLHNTLQNKQRNGG